MKRIIFVFGLLCALGFCGCGSVDPGQSTPSIHEESKEDVSVPTESSQAEESFEVSSCAPEESDISVPEESTDPTGEHVLEVKVEIYEESTQELLTAFALTDQNVCKEIFETFDKCFAELCEKYPRDAAPDKDVKTDYRVVIYLNTYYDADKENLAYYIDISYPFGYTNDIYRLMHHGGSPFGDYVARCGKPFIDMVDQYVKQYIPAE